MQWEMRELGRERRLREVIESRRQKGELRLMGREKMKGQMGEQGMGVLLRRVKGVVYGRMVWRRRGRAKVRMTGRMGMAVRACRNRRASRQRLMI